MPHKNGWCRGTKEEPHIRYKLKHHRWIGEYENWGKDRFNRGEYWERELICPKCGMIHRDIMMRTRRALKRMREKNESTIN